MGLARKEEVVIQALAKAVMITGRERNQRVVSAIKRVSNNALVKGTGRLW